MEKYKICPVCRAKNPPNLLECPICEADLTKVKVTDEETENMMQAQAEEVEQSERLVRVCECGTKNPPNARKCTACGEEISDITPTPEGEETAPPEFVLSSLDGKYAYRITSEVTVVGREHAMSEYLEEKNFVSREQAKLICEGEALFVEHLSKKNPTFVNDVPISGKTRLFDGDELGLGGKNINGSRQDGAAYFLVRICVCT